MMSNGLSHLTMHAEDFLRLRDLIHQYCGILLTDNLQFIVERRLRTRLEAMGVATFSEYYRAVKYAKDPSRELVEIVDLITTNETYFFREEQQLECFVHELIPDLLRERDIRMPLRIWSAGCSSGEEPFSVAMLLAEMAALPAVGVDIFGSDISRKVLRQARLGQYRELALRQTNAQRRQRFFTPEQNHWLLHDEIRRMVSFGQINLFDDSALSLMANVDVVLCRNVMIYFSKESRAKLLDSFYRKMRPGGYLLLGHSESLLNTSSPFEVVSLNRDIVYRKPRTARNITAQHTHVDRFTMEKRQ